MKTILVFQGGGALGAFAAGAWQALAESSATAPGTLTAVAGSSIGALNAAVVAHHLRDPDRGAQAMSELWLGSLATPSLPFFGPWPVPVAPSGALANHWNGLLTGLLVGNRGLSLAAWAGWQPAAGLWRLQQPLHDRRSMHALLQREFPSYSSEPDTSQPMLAAVSVDVMAGTLRLFDSDAQAITPVELAASSALPLLFDPVEIDGRLYWDGDVSRDSPLPLLLDTLQARGRLAADEAVLLITVEPMARALAARPQSSAEIAYRALTLLQVDKLSLPIGDASRAITHCRIQREPWPEDGVSGQMDFSPERLVRLMVQGRSAAEAALAAAGLSPAPAPAPAPPSRSALDVSSVSPESEASTEGDARRTLAPAAP